MTATSPVLPKITAAWVMVALGFLALALSFSARAAFGLAMPQWQAEFGWSRSVISLAGSVALVVMACLAPLVGGLVDREGPRRVLTFGLLVLAAGAIGLAALESLLLLFLAYSLVAALGFGAVAMHVVATAVAGLFQAGRGLAIGIATAGATAGQLVIVPLLGALQQDLDWRWSFAALGLACLLLAPAAWRTAPPRAARPVQAGEAAAGLAAALSVLLRSGPFHLLFWSFALCGFTSTGVIETHFLPYAAFCGFPPLPSATAYGLLSAVNLGGMILAGWLTDRMRRPLLLGLIYLGRAATFILLLRVADLTELYLFAVLFGLFDYATVPVTAALVARRLGLGIMGLAMGLISAGHSLGGAAGALLGGLLFDLQARYDGLWLASLALAVLAGLLALLLRDPPTAAERAGGRPASSPA